MPLIRGQWSRYLIMNGALRQTCTARLAALPPTAALVDRALPHIATGSVAPYSKVQSLAPQTLTLRLFLDRWHGMVSLQYFGR
jgi:hypothetical protein